jgi:hypothetical protein
VVPLRVCIRLPLPGLGGLGRAFGHVTEGKQVSCGLSMPRRCVPCPGR